MNSALIGHTGFVGSTLERGGGYQHLFNSRNIETIRGRRFDRVVCAGVSAVKWQANKDPEADWAGIQRLLGPLEEVEAEVFTLISTVDVYPTPVSVTERDEPDRTAGQPYGRHRLAVEDWVRSRFPRVHVIRLPGLFGAGLKKNIIFDMLTDNNLEVINPDSTFQWYDLSRLSGDLARAEALGLELVNMAVEPVSTEAIRSRFFPDKEIGARPAPAGAYDMRSVHAAAFGGSGVYQISASEVMQRMGVFLDEAR